MASYGTGTVRVGGIPSGYPTDPHEAANLNIRWVDEMVVDLSDYKSLKLIKLVGGLDSFTFNAGKIEWVEDDLYRRSDALGAELLTAGVTLTVPAARFFPKGTVIELVDDADSEGTYARELVLVTAQASATTLTISRAFAGTSDPGTTYASGAAFRVAGFAHGDGQDWTNIMTSMKALEYNYPSIIAYGINSTFRNEGIARYGQSGVGTDFPEQVAKALKRAVVSLESGLLLGHRYEGASDALPSMSGGLLEFIDSGFGGPNSASIVETDKEGNPLTLKDINDTLQNSARVVGDDNVATTIVCDYWGHRKINSFFEPSVRLAREENEVGLIVQRMDTVVGQVQFLSDNLMPPGVMLFLAPDQVDVGHMEGLGRLHTGDNPARAGDNFQKYVYGDYANRIKNPVTMAKIMNYSQDS